MYKKAQKMISQLQKHPKFYELLFLGVSTIACFALSVFRAVYTDTVVYLFLNWNLFLAGIPWMLSSLVLLKPSLWKSKGMMVLLLGTWLLFFPNAPYILTDLYHLKLKTGVPTWFDLILILSFAWTGLLYGILSLLDIEKILLKSMTQTKVIIISILLLFVTSFGVYLGRFLRWNSWDIISNPLGLFQDILERFIYPFEHPRTWGMTILFGIFLNMIYWSFRLIMKIRHERAVVQ